MLIPIFALCFFTLELLDGYRIKMLFWFHEVWWCKFFFLIIFATFFEVLDLKFVFSLVWPTNLILYSATIHTKPLWILDFQTYSSLVRYWKSLSPLILSFSYLCVFWSILDFLLVFPLKILKCWCWFLHLLDADIQEVLQNSIYEICQDTFHILS